MTTFTYVEFYDVPRTLALTHRGKFYLLQSAFDDTRDDYHEEYSVYLLPDFTKAQIDKGDWRFLGKMHLKPIGSIPIQSISFDRTKRRELDASILDTPGQCEPL